MIKLTLYNDSDVIVNADLIEFVERTPDTLVSLTTGKKVMVKESVEDVICKVVSYQRLVSRKARLFGPRGKSCLKTSIQGERALSLARSRGFETWT